MKKLTLALLFAAATLGFKSQAQILYKVEKPGNDKVSYILGTHHFAPVSLLDSLTQLPAALEGAEKVYGELDMAKAMDPASMMTMQQYMMAPSDSTLDKVLTPAQLDTLGNALNEIAGGQVPLQMMYGMKPAVVSTQIASMLAMKVLPDLNPMEGIDKTVQDRANALGKEVSGLESVDFQMKKLFGTPISKQAESLMRTVRNIEKEEKGAVELANAYMNRDLNKLEALMTEEESDPEMLESILYSRNDLWITTLSEEMPGKAMLVVVGAGHLPGERGVLEGLRKKGFTITPVE